MDEGMLDAFKQIQQYQLKRRQSMTSTVATGVSYTSDFRRSKEKNFMGLRSVKHGGQATGLPHFNSPPVIGGLALRYVVTHHNRKMDWYTNAQD
ncbi:hypothetical protein TNCV_3309761 [Trichonephila clavipes]|nr:hypothetical protein TNCV_3309761 [Trichonephila clavipes]